MYNPSHPRYIIPYIVALFVATGIHAQNTDSVLCYTEKIKQINATLQKQIPDFKSAYQVKELQQRVKESEQRIHVTYTIIASMSLVCTLSVIIIFRIRRKLKQQKEKNKLLYIELKELDKYKAAFRAIASENKHNSVKSNELYERINSYVINSKYYLESNISRENLAARMGTNYKYLADAVKEATGKTFNDYITDLKLECARDLLMSNPDERIQVIFNSTGFNNKTTFNRLFTKKFGLTPTDFRKMVREMQSESTEF